MTISCRNFLHITVFLIIEKCLYGPKILCRNFEKQKKDPKFLKICIYFRFKTESWEISNYTKVENEVGNEVGNEVENEGEKEVKIRFSFFELSLNGYSYYPELLIVPDLICNRKDS